MTAMYRSWSGPARVLALAIDAAVTAARVGDPDGFAAALAGLHRVDRELLGTVLGAVVTDLLETRHADGLDSDDAEAVLTGLGPDGLAPYLDRALGELLRAQTVELP